MSLFYEKSAHGQRAVRACMWSGLPFRKPSPTIPAGLFASGGFMNANCGWGFHFGLVLAPALVAFAASTSVFAYTPEQQQACTPDAMRLCGAYVPDVDRITACMIERKSQLSPECRRYFRPGPEPEEMAADQPTDIKPVARKPSRAKAKAASGKAKKPKKPVKPAAT